MAARTPSAWSTPSSSSGSSSGNFNFSDFSYNPSNFSTDVYTNPDTSRIYENVFGASDAPRYDFPTTYSYDNSNSDVFNRTWDPGTSNILSSSSSQDKPAWTEYAKLATDLANAWRGTSTSRSSGYERERGTEGTTISSPGSKVTPLGSGAALIERPSKVTRKTTGGSSGGGFLGPIGSLVGAGVGALVAGPGGALAGASLGSSLGGTAGSLADRTFFG